MENQPKLQSDKIEHNKKVWKNPTIELISQDTIQGGTLAAPFEQHLTISGQPYVGAGSS